jgi:ATP-dependent RNA helicase RhlE
MQYKITRNVGSFDRNKPSRARSGGSRGGNRFGSKQRIDVSRYMNKPTAPVEEAPAYIPVNTFADFKVLPGLKNNIIAKGYTLPTPIQDQSIPVILDGKDIVGIANTGTGKTAAFLIPLINKVLIGKREQVLIVAPTRELALQINDELAGFAKGLRLHSVTCVGGMPIGRQLSGLRYHNEFIIGTPGRIKDLIERNALDLSGFKTVVLDEADRMLDMGFINDMKFLMSKMSKENRQTLFFSATLSPEIDRLIKDFLKDPVRVSVKTQDTAKNIEQDVVRVKDGSTKIDTLHDLLKTEGFHKVLVFGQTKHGVEKLSELLVKRGFKAVSIHGNKNQAQRQRALDDFKAGRIDIMVATDVAARGLDINDITHVINYDLPTTHEDYIHRIGRTGRGNKKGKAFTFVD